MTPVAHLLQELTLKIFLGHLISKENLERRYCNACLPLIMANSKMETESPETQETK